MKFIFEDKKTGIETFSNTYNRESYKEPIEGKHNLKIYVIVDKYPNYDLDYETLILGTIDKTKKNYEGLEHLLVAHQNYTAVAKDLNPVIQELDNNLSNYLDNNYPVWQRDKHLRQISLSKVSGNKLTHLRNLDNWVDECRNLRDTKEIQIKNNERPSINDWPIKPSETI